jgi:hypothetical protein
MKPKTVASKIKKMLGKTEHTLRCLQDKEKTIVQLAYQDFLPIPDMKGKIESIHPSVKVESIERYHSHDALEYAEATMLYNFLYNIDLSTIIREK